MINIRQWRAAACLILASMAAVSCSPSPHPLAEAADGDAGGARTEKLIAYLPSGMTSPFYSQAAQSAALTGEKYGLKLEAQAPPAETDFNGQVAIFENFISKKVDGILFCAIDDQVLVPSIRKANAAGIPLVVFNSLTPQRGGKIDGYVGYNQYKAGFRVGEYAARLLKGKGKVFIVRGVPGYHDSLRTQGFREALTSYPGIRIVGEQAADWVSTPCSASMTRRRSAPTWRRKRPTVPTSSSCRSTAPRTRWISSRKTTCSARRRRSTRRRKS